MLDSFVVAGFDCTYGRNRHGDRIDAVRATGHDRFVDDDYRRLSELGIRCARDGVTWPSIEVRPGHYDWRSLDRLMAASQAQAVQVIHDFCHFGYPEHLDIFHASFVDAYAAFCFEAASRLRRGIDGPLLVTPFNEPSYFAWAAGHAARFPPYRTHRAPEMKLQLARAMIAGIEAIWRADPQARIVNVDPVCRAVAPPDRPELAAQALRFTTGAVLEMWDMLSGRLHPELGGSRRHLGIMGLNYYWTNQWELGSEDVPLPEDDPRRWTLSALCDFVWRRYGAPMVLSETGHLGPRRADWARMVAEHAIALTRSGVPLLGVCFYPILGMPDWHSPERWLDMGLWDVAADGRRTLHVPFHEALAGLLSPRGAAAQERTIDHG
jgi:hypothetical protein